jgi:hypothetical protein
MVKIQYVAIAILAVLVIAAVGAIVYENNSNSTGSGAGTIQATASSTASANGSAQATPAAGASAIPIIGNSTNNVKNGSQVTAFNALSVVDSDPSVVEWKSQRTNVSVTDISSEECEDGLSSTWSITYISDGEQAQLIYDNGAVSSITKSEIPAGALLPPTMVTGSLMDSYTAYGTAIVNLTSMNQTPVGPASMELSPGTGNTSFWDVIYPIENGYYLVRLNAADGQVIASTQYGSG